MPSKLPMDGTHIFTQTQPPPIIQFEVKVEGAVLTRGDDTFTWDEGEGCWKNGQNHFLFVHPAYPPERPAQSWMEADGRSSPAKGYAGTW